MKPKCLFCSGSEARNRLCARHWVAVQVANDKPLAAAEAAEELGVGIAFVRLIQTVHRTFPVTADEVFV